MKFLMLFCLIGISVEKKLPDFINVCRPKHTDINECVRQNVESLREKLKVGIPEMQIPATDPFLVPFADLKVSDNFHLIIRNLRIYVLKPFIIEDLNVDLEKLKLYAKLRFPQVKGIADYKVKGKVLILNLDSAGSGQINLTDVDINLTGSGRKEKRKGKDYIIVQDISIKHQLNNISLQFDNLFANNQELTDTANTLFNENQKVFIEDFSPLIIKLSKDIISNFLNNFFKRYSLDDLFPSN